MGKSPKHVLIVAHHYPPHISGVGMVAHNHAKRLAALGYVVTVITSRTSSDEKSYCADGVTVIRIKAFNFSEKWGAPFPIFSPMLVPIVFSSVRRSDIVHVHDAFYMSSFFAALFAWAYQKPVLLTQHVAMIAHPSTSIVAIEKIVYATTGAMIFRFSKQILTYNERVEKFLLSRGVDKRKLSTLHNGVDTEFFRPATTPEKEVLRKKFGFDPKKKTILFVGRFVPKKGLDKVLAIRSDEYQIACAGGENLKETSRDVLFLGKLNQKTLLQAYQAADIFLLPSESEGFPLSIQEAMASGLPIVATNDPGYEHYDFDKKLIYFLDNPTGTSLQQAIREIIQGNNLLAAMSEYSTRYAQTNFSWQRAISQLEKIYDSLLVKKKIAIISDAVYPFSKGGKEKRIYDITTRLAREGHDVTIYCMQWWKGQKTIVQNGVTLHAISPYYPLYAGNRRSIKEAAFFALHCFKLINKNFDVVDVDHMPHPVLFSMKIVCVLRRKKMIATWHEVWGKEYWKTYLKTGGTFAYWVEKISAQLPDMIISVSSRTTLNLRNVLRTKREILTIPNGLDMAGITGNSPAQTGTDAVFAGRLLSHKNVDVLLRATKILAERNPKISLSIIGDGPAKANLEILAKELCIEKNVSFLGFLEDHNELYRIMLASRVFVLPSTREGFGIAVLEANACGMPVVTINEEQNAARDLIINGENGMTTKLDEEPIANAIEKMLDSKTDRATYRTYAEKYDWTNILSTIQEVYAL